jgi:phosphatidylserine decarboxylase
MRIDRAGIPFIAGALLCGAACMAFGLVPWATVAAVGAGFFAFFFRDPERRVPALPGTVVSPADGRVVFAGAAEAGVAPSGAWQQVSVFLSPLDVHVNRVPVGGTVTRVDRSAGRFLPAYRREAAAENERCEIWIERGARTVVCRQVVGVLARRIVCRLSAGMSVATGQRFGIMKFGSRMDVFLPTGASLLVKAGDVVRGGETILATLGGVGSDG